MNPDVPTDRPFDQLRAVDRPVPPDRAFAARLRRRMVAALADPHADDLPTIALSERNDIMSTPSDAAMASTMTTTGEPTRAPAAGPLTPYLAVHDATRAIEWYTAVFGAIETMRYVGDDGRIGHADLSIGNVSIMLSDEYPDFDAVSPRTLGGTPVALHLVVPDVDATWATAIEHGADGRRPPEDQPYGDRAGTFIDPFGHRWMVSTPVGTPSPREIDDASDGFTVITPEP